MNTKVAIILTILSWAFCLMVLVTLIIPNSHVNFDEKECTVKNFFTDARFEPHVECTKEDAIELDTCAVVEKSTLAIFSPKLCLVSKYGPKDIVCPSPTPCDGGKKWFTEKALCIIHFPLAYNVSVEYEVQDIGTILTSKDLGDDVTTYEKYRDYYHVGERHMCQIVKKNGEIVWLDHLMTQGGLEWWVWFIFSITLILSIGGTVTFIVTHLFSTRRVVTYEPIDGRDEI